MVCGQCPPYVSGNSNVNNLLDKEEDISASLLAENGNSSFNKTVDARNIIIESFPVFSPLKDGFITNINPFNVSISKVDINQTSTHQTDVFENSLLEISSTQIGVSKGRITQIGSLKNSFSEISSFNIGISKIGIPEVAISSIDTVQVNPTQIQSTQIQPTQIALPSSITSQQLFSSNFSHNSSPNLLTNIYNTAQTLWHTTTPIDLTFEI